MDTGKDAGTANLPGPVDGGLACSPSTCAGCCLAGVCIRLGDQTAGTCGVQGAACRACLTGEMCDVGLCLPQESCSAANCANGCCYAGTCVALNAQDNVACGTGAEACGRCVVGTRCSQGACATPPPAPDAGPCGPDTCPQGCCSGESCIVAAAQNAGACGTGGGACEACLTGQACEAGTCASGAGCGPDNCPGGCCAGAVCVAFAAQGPGACGTGGEACTGCATGESCTGGVCTVPSGGGGGGGSGATCDASNCAGGCCFGTQCVGPSGQGAGRCGSGGDPCAACGPGEGCTSGACVPTASGADAGSGSSGEEPQGPDDDGSSSGSNLSGRTTAPPLPPGNPGGWANATFVFSQARMVKNAQDDDFVQLGWVVLNAGATATACGGTGPKVVKNYYQWKHSDYAPGDCPSDKKDGVDFARWDHAALNVDGCPGKTGFVENGQPATRPFLSNCDAHVTSGFGDPAGRRPVLTGNYNYDPAARTLVFRFDVNGTCKKEYYRDLTLDAAGQLLAMRLDGTKTGDTTATSRGTGATHGYAYGSPKTMSQAAPFSTSMQALAAAAQVGSTAFFLSDTWRLREARTGQPEHQNDNSRLGMSPQSCKTGVYYDHSCASVDPQVNEPPYLAECAQQPNKTAYLRWLVNPFPATSPREQLYWAWHAHHAPNWTGCYHRGSHANPMLQVVDAQGSFRGYVGVEMQRSAKTEPASGGGYRAATDSYEETDYRVWRWIQSGYEEIVGP
ncbi:MAG: hypothetical protein RL653_215 [Pseudomonadota bacterium]